MNYNNSETEKIAQKLKKAKLKITPQRMAILGELTDNCDHPTADAIYQKIKKNVSIFSPLCINT